MVLGMRPLVRQMEIKKLSKMGEYVNDKKPTQNSKTQIILFCAGYQAGECKEGDIHNDVIYKKSWLVRHFCANCGVQRE